MEHQIRLTIVHSNIISVVLKGGYALFDMCISTLNRLTLTPDTHFAQCDTGDEGFFNENNKKIKSGIPEIGTLSAVSSTA